MIFQIFLTKMKIGSWNRKGIIPLAIDFWQDFQNVASFPCSENKKKSEMPKKKNVTMIKQLWGKVTCIYPSWNSKTAVSSHQINHFHFQLLEASLVFLFQVLWSVPGAPLKHLLLILNYSWKFEEITTVLQAWT